MRHADAGAARAEQRRVLEAELRAYLEAPGDWDWPAFKQGKKNVGNRFAFYGTQEYAGWDFGNHDDHVCATFWYEDGSWRRSHIRAFRYEEVGRWHDSYDEFNDLSCYDPDEFEVGYFERDSADRLRSIYIDKLCDELWREHEQAQWGERWERPDWVEECEALDYYERTGRMICLMD